MAKISFINFGSTQYMHRQMLQLLSAKIAGQADQVHGYQPGDLKKLGFYNSRAWARPSQKGFSFWSWKPFIIHHALQCLRDGDLLVYSDIGRPWTRMFYHSLTFSRVWLEKLHQDVMPGVYIPYSGTLENWTKATTLKRMGVTLSPDILYSPPIQASFSIWKRTPASLDLSAEWEEKSRHQELIGDYDVHTDEPNSPSFIDHRHDQAIFSILCYQRHINALYDIDGDRPENDKDLDAWLRIQGASKNWANGILKGLSTSVKNVETAARFCLKK